MRKPLDMKYFFTIFAIVLVVILLVFGYDYVDKARIEKYGVEGYKKADILVKWNEEKIDIKLDGLKYGQNMELNRECLNHGDGEELILKEVHTGVNSFRIHFVSNAYSSYYHGRVFSMDEFKGGRVYTDAGEFYLEFVEKKKNEKDSYSYYYDVVSHDSTSKDDIKNVTEMEFSIDNICEYNYFQEDFDLDFVQKVFIICGVLICWIISGNRMFRKREWIADLNKDELEFLPEYEDRGHYVYKYTLAGAILRSMALGAMVSIVLYITSSLWVGVINDMTLGMLLAITDEEILILVSGIIVALLYLRHISDDIIREIKVDE